jgi:hypothetical protein
VPDAKTLWLFRVHLARYGLIEKLLQRFGEQLWQFGLMPRGGQISGVSLVNIPKNRNARDENKLIKACKTPGARDDEPNTRRTRTRMPAGPRSTGRATAA